MDNYKTFLRELVDDAVREGHIELVCTELFWTYTRIIKADYAEIAKQAFINWRKENA